MGTCLIYKNAKYERTTDETPRNRGILILPAIGLFGSMIGAVVGAQRVLSQMMSNKMDALVDPESPLYHHLWRTGLYFELAGAVLQFAFCVFLTALFISKSVRLPKAMISWLMLNVGLQFADLVFLHTIANDYTDEVGAAFRAGIKTDDFIRSALGAAVWIPYFLTSRRVKNTFVNS